MWDPGDLEQERQSGWKGSVPVFANQSLASVGRKKRLLQGFRTKQLHPGLSLSRRDVEERFGTAGEAVTIAHVALQPLPGHDGSAGLLCPPAAGCAACCQCEPYLGSHLNASGGTAVV